MPLRIRRGLSWSATLLLIAAAILGARYVPGYGGVESEIRWLLARDNIQARHTNAAAEILDRIGAAGGVDVLCRHCAALLRDPDDRVVRGMLMIATDRWGCWTDCCAKEPQTRLLLEWLPAVGLARALRLLPYSHAAPIGAIWAPVDFGYPLSDPLYNLQLPGTGEIQMRFDLAASATASYATWLRANYGAHVLSLWVQLGEDRLNPLNALDFDSSWRFMGAREEAILTAERPESELWSAPLGAESPTRQLLFDCLRDPVPEVRWGAGRVLAVIGDERGLPAFCEWLAAHPAATKRAERLMTLIYGDDWRSRSASGCTTRESGPGDGR